MPLHIVKITPSAVRVRVSTVSPDVSREYTVDRTNAGPKAAMIATADNGETCTLGIFKTRDGTAWQPDYARLRKLIAA